MVRLGLTGGIGSGKSTVAAMMAELGASVIDADAISRSLTAAGGAAIGQIAESFGPEFITPHGALDRDQMRSATFASPAMRARLEGIVHPLVGQESARQEAAAVAAGAICIVFDIPLLVESGRWRHRVDHVMVVDCPPEVQVARVVARNGLAAAVVERIIASQATRAQRLSCADVVLYNAGESTEPLARDLRWIAQHFGL